MAACKLSIAMAGMHRRLTYPMKITKFCCWVTNCFYAAETEPDEQLSAQLEALLTANGDNAEVIALGAPGFIRHIITKG